MDVWLAPELRSCLAQRGFPGLLAGAPDAPEPVAMALHPVRNHDGLDILKS